MQSINPSTGELLKEYPLTIDPESCIEKVSNAQKKWAKLSINERLKPLKTLESNLSKKASYYAEVIHQEMGKPLKEAEGEVKKCAFLCSYYADNAQKFLADEPSPDGPGNSFVTFDPLGIVLGIMPWNFPFWQVFRFAVPAVTAGNGALLKHASNVTGCALEIEKLLTQSGFPENLFRALVLPGEEVDKLIENPAISAVTLTGSEPAGMAVAKKCGELLKKTVLELGGSDPFIVLEDADLDKTVEGALNGRLQNTGQSCIAAKRFFIHEKVYEKFVSMLVKKCQNRVLGPLARDDLRRQLHNQVEQAIQEGAQCLTGGSIPSGNGFFYPATILTNVTKEMTVFREETFGPIFAIIKIDTVDEALELANHSSFGLGGSVWTENRSLGEAAARQIQSGVIAVNEITQSHPALPFGGVKRSGYGRELYHYGIKEFVNIKSITIH